MIAFQYMFTGMAMAVIGDVYPRERRASALGTLGAIDTAGWVWGPLYGALLIRSDRRTVARCCRSG